MVALVEARTPLKRAGANSFFGCCPFHDERTASFHVRPIEKHYHCFGCQASGDPFRFVMETDGLSFPEAIEALAERFGVRVEPKEDDPLAVERRKRRERLLQLLERTTGYYQRVLAESKEAEPARQLLAARGLSTETLERYRIGYSPSAWDRVLVASREAGFTEEELEAAGLVRKARDRDQLFDRFRGRIMFPLADQRGRVLGFGARAMRDEQGPKYLNSSEGEIYHKGSQLYGIHLARAEAAKTGAVVVVEGYVDALAMSQSGVSNVVAIMGTALTDEQAQQLERTAPALLLALDADKAGQAAMLKVGNVAAGRRLELRVVPMPVGKDPGDLLLEEGPDRLRSRVSASEPFVSFRVRTVLDSADLSGAEGKDRALAELRPIMAAQPPSVLREELIRRIAAELDLSAEMVTSLVSTGSSQPASQGRRHSGGGSRAGSPATVSTDRIAQVERGFLSTCAAQTERGAELLSGMDLEEWFTGDLERRAAELLRDRPEDPLRGLDSEAEEQLSGLVAAILSRASAMGPSAAALELEYQQMDLRRHDRLIERARRDDPGQAAELAASREVVRKRIDRATDAMQDELDLQS